MGSYYIPSNKLKGENRILYIFTGKSLIYTAVGAFVGLIFYLILSLINLSEVGLIITGIFALIGYGIGTIKMPTTGSTKISKNVGGESIDEIILHYIKFRKKKKVYSYAVPRKDPDYIDSNNISNLTSTFTKTNNTKEDIK